MGVVLADRSSRRLIFSIKPKEKEELVEKKRSLMVRAPFHLFVVTLVCLLSFKLFIAYEFLSTYLCSIIYSVRTLSITAISC